MFNKKIITFVLSFSFLFFFQYSASAEAFYTNSFGVSMTKAEYEHLKNIGYTELAIEQMTKERFDINKDLKLKSKISVTKYYQITETSENNTSTYTNSLDKQEHKKYVSKEISKDEYFTKVNAKRSLSLMAISDASTGTDEAYTSYRRVTTDIMEWFQGTRRVHQYFTWDIIPKTRDIDVLSISLDKYFTPIPNTQYAQQFWTGYDTKPTLGNYTSGSAEYQSSSGKWTKSAAGYGVKMNLKNDEPDITGYTVDKLEGQMEYLIGLNSPSAPNYVNAYGNYSHAKTTIENEFTYELSYGGPAISWSGVSVTTFDSLTTHAQLSY